MVGEEESKLLICRSFFHLKELHGGNTAKTPRGQGSLKSVPSLALCERRHHGSQEQPTGSP